MNGIHDLGGMDGLGPINPTKEEPCFKDDWERQMFGLFVYSATPSSAWAQHITSKQAIMSIGLPRSKPC